MASNAEDSNKEPWNTETKQKFSSKSRSEYYDPCQEAAQRSYKCLFRNNGDKSMCGEYFQYVTIEAWTYSRRGMLTVSQGVSRVQAGMDRKTAPPWKGRWHIASPSKQIDVKIIESWLRFTKMNQQRPRLKNGVDLQLQSAFHDGNWQVVYRLAEKRARTFNDQYFEIVKICAESQFDDPGSKYEAVSKVWQFIRDDVVVKDVDAISLLEWASLDFIAESDYTESLGTLRVRAVKASPKDRNAAVQSLESCLLHWDLVNAQQIAAVLDRSFPQERMLLFWNIAITHLLATSSQAPADKKKLYGTLAQRQIERAAQLAEQEQAGDNKDAAKLSPRTVQTEEEILLLYEIVERHGSDSDFQKLLSSAVFSPQIQFRRGRKELFMRVAMRHKANSNWDALYSLCKDCLSETDENGQPHLLACDWAVWQLFIEAAQQTTNPDTEAQKEVQDLLDTLRASTHIRPIYTRNLQLAQASIAFSLTVNDDVDLRDGKAVSPRLQELQSYIRQYKNTLACFDDVKGFVDKLEPSAMKYVAYEFVPSLTAETESSIEVARIKVLALKLQYFVSSCQSTYTPVSSEEPGHKCAVCSAVSSAPACSECLNKIIKAALSLHSSLSPSASEHPAFSSEVLPEIAILIAYCSIRLATQDGKPQYTAPNPASTRHLLRALLVLEQQLSAFPKHSLLSLLLVQLHIMVGSGSRTREVWDVLGVKRTIMDSLAPLFFDRLSTIAPAIISSADDWGWELIDMLSSHYTTSLKLRMPRRLIDAFQTGSYASVLSVPKYIDNLRSSCTRAMSLVEEARTERLFGIPYGEFLQDPRYADVTDDLELTEALDYGSFPSWDSSSSTPAYARLRVGPPISNRRAHLSLLSEAFHEVLTYKPPASYKANSNSDQVFVLETMGQLCNSLHKFLPGAQASCTALEVSYFEIISLLSGLLPLGTSLIVSADHLQDFVGLTGAVKIALENIRLSLPSSEDNDVSSVVGVLASLHNVTMLRDAATAAQIAAKWILALNDRERERDRSGKTSLPKDAVAQMKDLQSAAEAVLKEGKAVTSKLYDEVVSKKDFTQRFKQWVFEDEADIGKFVGSTAVAELVASWSMNNCESVRQTAVLPRQVTGTSWWPSPANAAPFCFTTFPSISTGIFSFCLPSCTALLATGTNELEPGLIDLLIILLSQPKSRFETAKMNVTHLGGFVTAQLSAPESFIALQRQLTNVPTPKRVKRVENNLILLFQVLKHYSSLKDSENDPPFLARDIANFYVTARSRAMQKTKWRRFSSLLTQLVDEWASFQRLAWPLPRDLDKVWAERRSSWAGLKFNRIQGLLYGTVHLPIPDACPASDLGSKSSNSGVGTGETRQGSSREQVLDSSRSYSPSDDDCVIIKVDPDPRSLTRLALRQRFPEESIAPGTKAATKEKSNPQNTEGNRGEEREQAALTKTNSSKGLKTKRPAPPESPNIEDNTNKKRKLEVADEPDVHQENLTESANETQLQRPTAQLTNDPAPQTADPDQTSGLGASQRHNALIQLRITEDSLIRGSHLLEQRLQAETSGSIATNLGGPWAMNSTVLPEREHGCHESRIRHMEKRLELMERRMEEESTWARSMGAFLYDANARTLESFKTLYGVVTQFQDVLKAFAVRKPRARLAE
ncbi:Cytochrome c oxidase-assembly factor cox-23 [Paramyrothecium foliicola]|nr:Cytochrome c oxidase-assembly factor cox-23 [Paramyrothecium foliicola]